MSETQACVYAALMLHDSGVEVTADSITTAVAASGMEVRPTLPILFARYLEKKSVESLIAAAAKSGGGAAPAGAAAAPAAAGGAAPAAAAKKKEESEEEDDDFGMGGLF